MKECSKCLKIKPSDTFGNDKRNKDGKQGMCYECCNFVRRNKYKNDINYRNTQKKRQKKYKSYANENAKKHIENISDFYVIKELIRGTTLSVEDIKKHPELIETKKQIIKNKRLCRKLKTLKI